MRLRHRKERHFYANYQRAARLLYRELVYGTRQWLAAAGRCATEVTSSPSIYCVEFLISLACQSRGEKCPNQRTWGILVQKCQKIQAECQFQKPADRPS